MLEEKEKINEKLWQRLMSEARRRGAERQKETDTEKQRPGEGDRGKERATETERDKDREKTNAAKRHKGRDKSCQSKLTPVPYFCKCHHLLCTIIPTVAM